MKLHNEKGGFMMQELAYYSNSDVEFSFFAFLAMFGIALVLFTIVLYVLGALVYYNTAKTNGLGDIAFLSWIPFAQTYVFFALGSTKKEASEIKKDALIWLLVYFGILVISFLPFLGFISSMAAFGFMIYFSYRIFYRWIGDSGKAVLFTIISIITLFIFFYIYGLIKMKQPFVAD